MRANAGPHSSESQVSAGSAAPDFYEPLRTHAQWAYEAFVSMRQHCLRDAANGGALSSLHKEYMLVALDIALRNEQGVRQHTRAAMRAGATLDGIVETVVLVMLTAGAITYRTSGYAAIEEASRWMSQAQAGHRGERDEQQT